MTSALLSCSRAEKLKDLLHLRRTYMQVSIFGDEGF